MGDVMTFESLKLTSFCLEKTSVRKNGISRFKLCFKLAFGWNQVKYARITTTYVCFIALTLTESLERCLRVKTASSGHGQC